MVPTCRNMHALRGYTQVHEQPLWLSDAEAFGEHKPAPWDPVELVWKQPKVVQLLGAKCFCLICQIFICLLEGAHHYTHPLILYVSPGVTLFWVAQSWSLICLSQATVPLLFWPGTFSKLAQGNGLTFLLNVWKLKMDHGRLVNANNRAEFMWFYLCLSPVRKSGSCNLQYGNRNFHRRAVVTGSGSSSLWGHLSLELDKAPLVCHYSKIFLILQYSERIFSAEVAQKNMIFIVWEMAAFWN